MTNWFYMDRRTFGELLYDELGPSLAPFLLSYSYDTPISFMIGETPDDILSKIQETFSLFNCQRKLCNENCLNCSITLPNYAKLYWFIQRLLIMSPLSKPFIKKSSSFTFIYDNPTTINQDKFSLISYKNELILFLIMAIIGIIWILLI